MVLDGPGWSCMVLDGSVWSCMVMDGHAWSWMVLDVDIFCSVVCFLAQVDVCLVGTIISTSPNLSSPRLQSLIRYVFGLITVCVMDGKDSDSVCVSFRAGTW